MLNSNLVGKCNVEDKKTGNTELKDAVWANAAPLERESYEDSLTAKTASKQFVRDKPTTATFQSFSKRMQNFTAGSEFDLKFWFVFWIHTSGVCTTDNVHTVHTCMRIHIHKLRSS